MNEAPSKPNYGQETETLIGVECRSISQSIQTKKPARLSKKKYYFFRKILKRSVLISKGLGEKITRMGSAKACKKIGIYLLILLHLTEGTFYYEYT
jgi:hypothetical protein